MGNKLKLKKLGSNSLWVLQKIGQGSFQVSDLVITSYIQAFFPRLRLHSDGSGYLVRVLERLIANNTIIKERDGSYRITTQGHWELARRRMLDKPEDHIRKNWDKKWRIVIFDIPELERQHRDVLRYAIRGYGMYQLQQSVWVYPYRCDEFVSSIKEDLGFNAEVLFITADAIENQSKLEEEFGLV